MENNTCEQNEFLALNMCEEDWKPVVSECCIYRVPSFQRETNPRAYTPQMVLIGPLHYAKKQQALKLMEMECPSADLETIESRYKMYLEMEKQKRIYYKSFCERVGTEVTDFRSIIESNEEKIRRCYVESTSSISSTEFVRMILLDAVFIIELFIRIFIPKWFEDDFVLSTNCLQTNLRSDLIMLENQLPFFVLEDLCNPELPKVFPEGEYHNFRDMSFAYFGIEHVTEDVEFEHFTDLLRYKRIRNLKLNSNPSNTVSHMYNATKLHEAGVHFEVLNDEDKCPINVSFEKKYFKMAQLVVDDTEEIKIRNIMALEQHHYVNETHMCDYVEFLDLLINTEKDVELLVHKGIIKNMIGDNKLVADMVNKLTYGNVQSQYSCYYDIAEKLNEYYDRFWNRTVANLKHNYFNNVWKAIATIAAVILLLLTLGQMITSIIEVIQGQDN